MPQDKLIQAIGRMERALSRLEKIDLKAMSNGHDVSDLQARHARLKVETSNALAEIDGILSGLDR